MAEYTIDELARAADTTVRNVRAYQARNLLPKPRRVGRANVYSEVHLARLRLIGRLLGRGYTLGNISEMIETLEAGEGMTDLLGLESALTEPWSHELPSYMTLAELSQRFGGPLRPTDLHQALRLELVRLEEDGRYLVPSPRLLNTGAELVRAGVPLSIVLQQLAQLRGDCGRIAERFVQLILEEVIDPYGEDALPPPEERPRLVEFIHRVRPMALVVVEVELGRALEDAIDRALGHRLARIAEAEGTRKAERR